MQAELKITTMDIATRVGMSRSTVANILNNSVGVKYSDRTRRKVLKAAEEVGYQASSLRRAIKRPLKHLAFVINNPNSVEFSYTGEIWKGIREATVEHEYQLMFCEADWALGNAADTEAKTRKMIDMVSSRVVDGLIIDKSRFGSGQMELLQKCNVPFVCINGRRPFDEITIKKMPEFRYQYEIDLKAHWVYIDHENGGYIATNHLIECGHTQIGLIIPRVSQYPLNFVPNMMSSRVGGYKRALSNNGIEVNESLIRESDGRDAICESVEKLLALPERPTAIFAADDAIAVLVVNYLQSKGVRVPEDMSVIGYGNWSVSAVCYPRLTTIHVPWATMGHIGTEILINLLNGKKVEHLKVLQTSFLEGESVKNR